MKNLARLTLFFSLSFAAFFFIAILLNFISSWIDMARLIPVDVRTGREAVNAAWKSLPAAVYLSILLSLNYSAQRKMPNLPAVFCVVFLGTILTLAASIGISRTGAVKPIFKPVAPVQAGPGLILTQSENAIILLKESGEVRGPRIVSIPGQPLIYQEVPLGPNNSIIGLPALKFGDDVPWFLKSIGLDFSICAAELRERLNENFLFFAAYCFSLVLLLSSMRFLLELSQWPLANLFLGALVFRGILSFETFLNDRGIGALIGSFMNKKVPPELFTPLIFAALGTLIIVYTLLAGIARRERLRDEDED
jgi:hypothetical protein